MEPDETLIKINTGLLAALSNGAISIDVMPKEILVLECLVAGTSFRKLQDLEPELISEVKLELKRDNKNEHDKMAVELLFNKNKIGFIPKKKK